MNTTGTTRLEKTIDSVVRAFSPRRAAMRVHFRRFDRDDDYRNTWIGMMHARGYRAAKGSDGKTPWLGGSRSADAEILNDLPAMRNRSRELNRDDPIASGLTGTFVRNIIGTGLRPQAMTTEPAKNTTMEAVWAERKDQLYPADNLTLAEAQAMLMEAVLSDGEIWDKQTTPRGGGPLFFEAIEADRVATPPNKFTTSPRGNQVRDGIVKNRLGKPVAYWIRKRHPGDVNQIATVGDANAFRRVSAATCKHLKMTRRPGQSRGVPIFHAMLQDLRDLDLLLIASIKRVQIAACLAVFIKSSANIEDMLGVTAQKEGYKLDQDIEPGMIFKLFPNESIETLIPNFPTPELGPFIIMIARRIGAALGVSWQVVLKDFSDSTYSSARTDLLETRPVYTIFRKWFTDKHSDWQWVAVMEDERLRNPARMRGITDADMRAVKWVGDGWTWIDPVKEAKAIEIELGTGISVLEEIWIARGKDPDQMWERLKRDNEKREEVGLPRPGAVEDDDNDDDDKAASSPGNNGPGRSFRGNGKTPAFHAAGMLR